MENDFIIYTESYYGPGTFPEKGRRGKKKRGNNKASGI